METDHELDPNILEEIPDTEQEFGPQDELMLNMVVKKYMTMAANEGEENKEEEGTWDSMAVIASEAWSEGNPDEIGLTREKLLPKGISQLTKDQAGTAFLSAAQTGLLDVVKDLHTAFGDCLLQFTDEDQYTALHRASYNGHLNIVEYLISAGANIHARTEDGWQPIHSACRWNKVDVASLLVQNGAIVNSQTNGCQTPLHLAACNNRAKPTLEFLLQLDDTDVTLRNSKGETAYELAASYGKCGYLFEMKEESIDFRFDNQT